MYFVLPDVSQPLSEVYRVPLSTAMQLMKTLCQAGRNMAATLVRFKIHSFLSYLYKIR